MEFPCPSCGTTIKLGGATGKGRCRKCGEWATRPEGDPAPPAPQATRPSRRARAGGDDQPRAHHYQFVHGLLPSLAFSDMPTFLGVGSTDEGVRKLWGLVASQLPVAQRLEPSGLSTWEEVYGEKHVLWGVVLPTPQRITEAWYAAWMIWPMGTTSGWLKKKENVGFRYFTLERTIDLGAPDRPATVLGEWAPHEGGMRHLNYGPGPASSAAGVSPDRAAFVAAVREKCERGA